jgi:hypothetical protein
MCGTALLLVLFAGGLLMLLTWERMAARRRRARDEMDVGSWAGNDPTTRR